MFGDVRQPSGSRGVGTAVNGRGVRGTLGRVRLLWIGLALGCFPNSAPAEYVAQVVKQWSIAGQPDLRAVWGSGPNQVFAVGANGTILRHDGPGTGWKSMPGASSDLFGIWGAGPNHVLAVGDAGDVYKYNGKQWALLSPKPANGEFWRDVWGTNPNNIYLVGTPSQLGDHTLVHYDGTNWALTGPAGSGGGHAWGVWGSGPSDVYVVGNVNNKAAIGRFDGTTWVTEPKQGTVPYTLRDVWGNGPNDVFVVGDSGTIGHRDGQWSILKSNTKSDLHAVGDSGLHHVYALGASGTMLVYDRQANAWMTMSSGTTNDLFGIWSSGPREFFAVGAKGTISRYWLFEYLRMAPHQVTLFAPEMVDWDSSGGLKSVGSVSTEYSPGTDQVTVTAVPEPGAEFSHWEGDLPEGLETENPLHLVLTQDVALGAVFSPTSPDYDMPSDDQNRDVGPEIPDLDELSDLIDCGHGACGAGATTMLPLMFVSLWKMKKPRT